MKYNEFSKIYSINKVNSHKQGIMSLTHELVSAYNHEPVKIVYVEGKDDMKLYNLMYSTCFQDGLLYLVYQT